MPKFIDKFLNNTTMYRLILYYLSGLVVLAMTFGLFGIMPFKPWWLLFSTIFITGITWLTNKIFALVFKAPSNDESVFITALILVLIISPLRNINDLNYFSIATWAPILAISSKYIIAIRKKHIFNPVAFGVAITALALNQAASWWVGTIILSPFILIGGIFVVKKILRADLVYSFILVALAGIIGSHLVNPATLLIIIEKTLTTSSLLFLAFVMLTEPFTTPPTAMLRICYGAIVGFLFVPAFHIGQFYFTPELALLVGNIFVYIVSPKTKLILKFKEKILIAKDAYDFVFNTEQDFNFKAGQYLELTFAHRHFDNRGIRRFFTIASSPTEKNISFGIKFYEPMSTFKRQLLKMKPGEILIGSQLSGEFTLPKDKTKKLVFIAGGIGITPFRSMIKNLIDLGEKRDITIFYCNRAKEDFAYTGYFDKADERLGIRTIYCITDTDPAPPNWQGELGKMDLATIRKYVPDFAERYYYISGPHSMVESFEKTLRSAGVKNNHIIKDYFPGFA